MAALALQQRLHQDSVLRVPLACTDVAVRMGVHSGLVVLGELGQDAPRRRHGGGRPDPGGPAGAGNKLRLGMLLLSAATYHLVHAEVRVAPYGTLAVDGGRPMPCRCTRCRGSWGATPGSRGGDCESAVPLWGGQRELALLHDRLEAVRAGEGQVVSLVGPPGMGKTRLLTEFGGRLAPDQVPWYRGHCLAYGQAIPYLPGA